MSSYYIQLVQPAPQIPTEDISKDLHELYNTSGASTSDQDSDISLISVLSSRSSSCTDSDNNSNSDESTFSATSTRSLQLQPHISMNYNETLLTKRHSQPQVWIMNNISIPFPTDEHINEKSSDSSTDI